MILGSRYSSPLIAKTLNKTGHKRLLIASLRSGNQIVIESVASDGAGKNSTFKPAMFAFVGLSKVFFGGI